MEQREPLCISSGKQHGTAPLGKFIGLHKGIHTPTTLLGAFPLLGNGKIFTQTHTHPDHSTMEGTV